jgi:hypothetical protein
MSGYDIFAWIVLVILVASAIGMFCIVGWLPGHIAKCAALARGTPTSHAVLDQANNCGEDRAGDTAADRLADQRANIDIARGSALQHRQQGGEKRPAARAADRAGDAVTECAEVEILHRAASGVSAERAGNKLNDQIDEGPRHFGSPSSCL